MSEVGKQRLVVYRSANGWRGEGSTTPQHLLLKSDSLGYGVAYRKNENLITDNRVRGTEAILLDPQKPEGQISFLPTPESFTHVLNSHFQKVNNETFDLDGDQFKYVPEKGRISWAGGMDYGEGGFGEPAGDAFSVEFLRVYDDSQVIAFNHGVCDKLALKVNANGVLNVVADYKFKTAGTITSTPAWDGEDQSNLSPYSSFNGTFSVAGNSIPLESLNIESKNNMLEKMTIGRETRDSFAFGDYEVTGDFSLDFPDDGLSFLTDALETNVGTIEGTFYNASNDFLAITMNNVVYKPNDTKLNNVRNHTVPFESFTNNDTSPIIITLRIPPTPSTLYNLDAGTVSRTLSQYFQYDAGTVARTLSEYRVYDRDLE